MERNSDSKPKNFRSAIDELERKTDGNGTDFRARLEEELSKIKDTLAKLDPHIDGIKTKVTDEFHTTKDKVEKEVLKNPWAAIGIVALVCFILGAIFSPRKGRD